MDMDSWKRDDIPCRCAPRPSDGLRCWLLAGILLLCLPLHPAQAHKDQSPHPFIVSGVIVNSDAAALIESFAKVLSEAAGYSLRVRFVDSYRALSEALREDTNALGWTCGAPFVEDHQRDGQQLVAIPLFRGQPTYHSLIITRRDRPERTLLDFKGEVFAYSDPRSNSGYVVPAYQLKKAGFDIRNYFRLLLHAGNHERSIEAVATGLADVAAVDEYVWVEYLKAHPEAARELREIERFGPFPFTPIVAGKNVDAETIRKLRQALLSLSRRDAGKQLLASFGLDGFTRKDEDFYRPIADMLHSLGGVKQGTP